LHNLVEKLKLKQKIIKKFKNNIYKI